MKKFLADHIDAETFFGFVADETAQSVLLTATLGLLERKSVQDSILELATASAIGSAAVDTWANEQGGLFKNIDVRRPGSSPLSNNFFDKKQLAFDVAATLFQLAPPEAIVQWRKSVSKSLFESYLVSNEHFDLLKYAVGTRTSPRSPPGEEFGDAVSACCSTYVVL